MSTEVTPGTVLASDAEREDAVRRLHEALGEGRLDHAETEQRSAAAAAARYREELAPLLSDLPPSSVRSSADVPSWTSIRETLVWRAYLLVWGPAADRPTPRQCRTATVLAVAGVVWFLLCAVLAASVVGA